jgi:hypothetical protein
MSVEKKKERKKTQTVLPGLLVALSGALTREARVRGVAQCVV